MLRPWLKEIKAKLVSKHEKAEEWVEKHSRLSKDKQRRIIEPFLVLLLILIIAACFKSTPLAAAFAMLWVSCHVYLAMSDEINQETLKAFLIDETNSATPQEKDAATMRLLYDKAIQMHIETDRGMYQIITVFVAASVAALGWVATNSSDKKMTADIVLIIGSVAVVLVGAATLLKHRLRYYNKLRELYLRNLEQLMLKSSGLPVTKSGLQNFMLTADHTLIEDAKKRGIPIGLSFHEVIDIYFWIHLIFWLGLYGWKLLSADSPAEQWFPEIIS